MRRGRGEAPSAAAEGTEAPRRSPPPKARRLGWAVDGGDCRARQSEEGAGAGAAQQGAPGVDGMTVDVLAAYLKDHWPEIRDQLLEGTYRPQPVRRVEIPKAAGGTWPLGIPTVLDRFIQQAVLQVLQAAWDPTFSEQSYGFRPGRSAHQAVARAQAYIARSRYRRGPRPGEVLRSGQPRHADGAGGQAGADKRMLKLIRGS